MDNMLPLTMHKCAELIWSPMSLVLTMLSSMGWYDIRGLVRHPWVGTTSVGWYDICGLVRHLWVGEVVEPSKRRPELHLKQQSFGFQVLHLQLVLYYPAVQGLQYLEFITKTPSQPVSNSWIFSSIFTYFYGFCHGKSSPSQPTI